MGSAAMIAAVRAAQGRKGFGCAACGEIEGLAGLPSSRPSADVRRVVAAFMLGKEATGGCIPGPRPRMCNAHAGDDVLQIRGRAVASRSLRDSRLIKVCIDPADAEAHPDIKGAVNALLRIAGAGMSVRSAAKAPADLRLAGRRGASRTIFPGCIQVEMKKPQYFAAIRELAEAAYGYALVEDTERTAAKAAAAAKAKRKRSRKKKAKKAAK